MKKHTQKSKLCKVAENDFQETQLGLDQFLRSLPDITVHTGRNYSVDISLTMAETYAQSIYIQLFQDFFDVSSSDLSRIGKEAQN